MKCPCCGQAELVEMDGEFFKNSSIKQTSLECPNCHAEFDDKDDVQSTIEDIECEQNAKHEEVYPEQEYEGDQDREPYNENDW